MHTQLDVRAASCNLRWVFAFFFAPPPLLPKAYLMFGLPLGWSGDVGLLCGRCCFA